MSADNHKFHILDQFVPALNMVLFTSAPRQFTAYMGSACRQTAVMVAHEMSQRMPEHEWRVFEGVFTGSPRGAEQCYDHAWVWGSCGLLIDANHRREHRVWSNSDRNEYPKHSAFALRWKELERKELPLAQMLDETEFYTGVTGRQLHILVSRLATLAPPPHLMEFDRAVYPKLRPEWMDANETQPIDV
jgi:hypothetical protein